VVNALDDQDRDAWRNVYSDQRERNLWAGYGPTGPNRGGMTIEPQANPLTVDNPMFSTERRSPPRRRLGIADPECLIERRRLS
jgi:hypothetical protein